MSTRKAIRKKVAELLRTLNVNGASVFDYDSVFSYRVTSIDEQFLPAAVVFIERAEIEEEHTNDLHVAELIIQLYAKSKLNVDDELDDLDELVNPLIKQHHTLDGLADSIALSSYDFSQDEQNHLGMLELKYTVNFEN